MNKIKEQDSFISDLKAASKIVKGWPLWKQTLLGPVKKPKVKEELELRFGNPPVGGVSVDGDEAIEQSLPEIRKLLFSIWESIVENHIKNEHPNEKLTRKQIKTITRKVIKALKKK